MLAHASHVESNNKHVHQHVHQKKGKTAEKNGSGEICVAPAGDNCETGGCRSCEANKGICMMGKCHCFPGFEGPDCSRGVSRSLFSLSSLFSLLFSLFSFLSSSLSLSLSLCLSLPLHLSLSTSHALPLLPLSPSPPPFCRHFGPSCSFQACLAGPTTQRARPNRGRPPNISRYHRPRGIAVRAGSAPPIASSSASPLLRRGSRGITAQSPPTWKGGGDAVRAAHGMPRTAASASPRAAGCPGLWPRRPRRALAPSAPSTLGNPTLGLLRLRHLHGHAPYASPPTGASTRRAGGAPWLVASHQRHRLQRHRLQRRPLAPQLPLPPSRRS